MLSRSQQKLLRKLRTKKYRWQERKFVAEGRKLVNELLAEGLVPDLLLAENPSDWRVPKVVEAGPGELREWTALDQSDEVLAVFPFPRFDDVRSDLVLVADRIADPGNLGTIVRTCDWFGINTIYCTTGTVDVYNAKTVQSTMGSIARVQVSYMDEAEVFENLKDYRWLCADMEGTPLTELKPEGKMALVMGSESHGPSAFWREHAERITISRKGNSRAESLNVATATAVILGRFCLP